MKLKMIYGTDPIGFAISSQPAAMGGAKKGAVKEKQNASKQDASSNGLSPLAIGLSLLLIVVVIASAARGFASIESDLTRTLISKSTALETRLDEQRSTSTLLTRSYVSMLAKSLDATMRATVARVSDRDGLNKADTLHVSMFLEHLIVAYKEIALEPLSPFDIEVLCPNLLAICIIASNLTTIFLAGHPPPGKQRLA